jgi:hypothetical protein
MKIFILCATFSFTFLSISCKHDHPPVSEELKQAFEIQKEGLSSIKKIETQLSNNLTAEQQKLKLKLEQYKSNMIEIEGLQHDHSQCNGDHSKKRFSIPDKEMLAVQTEWRDSINSILNKLNR